MPQPMPPGIRRNLAKADPSDDRQKAVAMMKSTPFADPSGLPSKAAGQARRGILDGLFPIAMPPFGETAIRVEGG